MTRNNFIGFLGTLLLVTVMSSGCIFDSVRPPTAVPTIDTQDPRAKLVLGSEDLLGKVALGDTKLRQVGVLTQAQVTVQNLTDNRYTLEYRFDWRDSQGFDVGSLNTWHRFTLTPRQTQTFNSMGKTPAANNIVFNLRVVDDAFIENYRQMERDK
jgi:uncharacterized protein YcfL